MKLVWNFALQPEMLKKYLTTEEVAEFLKMGVSTIEQSRLNEVARFSPDSARRYTLSS